MSDKEKIVQGYIYLLEGYMRDHKIDSRAFILLKGAIYRLNEYLDITKEANNGD